MHKVYRSRCSQYICNNTYVDMRCILYKLLNPLKLFINIYIGAINTQFLVSN